MLNRRSLRFTRRQLGIALIVLAGLLGAACGGAAEPLNSPAPTNAPSGADAVSSDSAVDEASDSGVDEDDASSVGDESFAPSYDDDPLSENAPVGTVPPAPSTTSPPTTENAGSSGDNADLSENGAADVIESPPVTPPTTSTTVLPNAEFVGTVFEIDAVTAGRMTESFREGCPVGLDQLRLLSLSHWNYAGAVAQGELVVHADWADEVVTVFEALFDGGFPIERMEIVDVFEGSDDLSMAANNTSGFNCREVAFRPGVWSNHAFGTAIDINPLVNPLVDGDLILPPEAEPFIDRSVQVVGGIYAGDVVTQAFADIGWGWGGDWTSLKDWQHFSASGG